MAVIGLNILFLIPNQVGGTEYLTRAFINALQTDKKHTYVLFCNKENAKTFVDLSPNVVCVECAVFASNRFARLCYEQFVLPLLLIRYRCTIVHSFGYTTPLWGIARRIVTIHDTNWLDHPSDFSFFTRLITTILVSLGMWRSSVILTDSTFAKHQIIRHFPQLSSRVKVILPIVSTDLVKPPFIRLEDRLHQTPFLLCVSAFYPHKRIPYLLQFWKEVQKTGHHLSLVLVGQHGNDQSTVKKMLADCPTVLYYPKVSYTLLKSLYHHAQGFVHPSIYEGFGYPVYEAYLAELPILVGNTNLYESRIQSSMNQFTFDIQRDAALVLKLAREKKNRATASLWSADESRNALLQVYEQMV